MTTMDKLLLTAECLNQFHRAENLVHIGVGRGTGGIHCWRNWDVNQALLIDADDAAPAWVDKELSIHSGWSYRCAIIAESDAERVFFHASNPSESGLLEPDRLTALWPNLQSIEATHRSSVRLDTLLSKLGSFPEPHWILLDCLPAATILRGAKSALAGCNVLWVRTMFGDLPEDYAGSRLSDIEAELASFPFRKVATASGTHPNIGEALFVRDWRAGLELRLKHLQVDHARLTAETEKLRSAGTAIQQAFAAQSVAERAGREEQASLAADRLAQLEQFRAENKALANGQKILEQRIESLNRAREDLAAARDNLAKLTGERELQLDALLSEKRTLVQDLDNFTQKIATLEREKTDIQESSKDQSERIGTLQRQVETLTQQTAKLAAEVTGLRQRSAVLEKEGGDLRSANEELAKGSTEHQQRAEALIAENRSLEVAQTKLMQSIATLEMEKSALASTTEENSMLSAVQARRIDNLVKEKAELSTTITRLEQQMTVLTAENANLARSAATRGKEADDYQQAIAEKNSHIERMKAEIAETQLRQQLLNEEMIRAEAQIDLIKDIWLREPGL